MDNDLFSDGQTGRPQWFKLWADKYADVLDIDNMDEDLSPEEKADLFADLGRAFINALFLFKYYTGDDEDLCSYKILTRDGRIIWNALKRDIDQSYSDYIKRVINGAKGGRPHKQT